ncbi:tetratricopeptide repeat protein [Rhabdochlamydiaceae symbiont of Dictyostelium giganteum]|uniref:tetratricopeptide repeat protein n=1 Tax=Rhabdochlamydiaceae symbiont of Dictyostelium giganteum TaxID=3342349 RepID=UPI00384CAC3B
MAIRPYSLIEAQSPQTPHEENSSSTLGEISHEKPSKQLRMDTFSADKIEASLSQNTESLKTEQIANAIFATAPNKNSDTNSPILSTHHIIEPLNDPSSREIESLIKLIDLNPKQTAPYFKLANLLKKDETVKLLNGKSYTEKKLYLKAIDLGAKERNFYSYLANCLEEDEMVQLLNGETYTQKDLYTKVIDLNSTCQFSYYNLAMILKTDETVELLNGNIYTQKELYIKAIDLNPKTYNPYDALAHFLEKNESIQLLNGECYTKKKLYLKAIDLNHQYSNAYNNLANSLEKYETIELLNGKEYTSKDLYIKAIDLDPKKGLYYHNLAGRLAENEIIKLLNGEIYTSKDLYIKAIDLDPENGNSYQLLAKLLDEGEKIQFLNGNFYTQKELFLKSLDLGSFRTYETHKFLKQIYIQEIEQNPKNIKSYFDLIIILDLQNKESYFDLITISRGISILTTEKFKINQKNISMEFLFREALDLDPVQAFSLQFAPAFLCMGSFLHSKTVSILDNLNSKLTIEDLSFKETLLKQGTSITLKNHQVLSTKAIYDHALSLLSLTYLKRRGDQEVGNYLSYRKPILLQDKVKFTKLMAYTYAYQSNQLPTLLMKIGDALHPERLSVNLIKLLLWYNHSSNHRRKKPWLGKIIRLI